MHSEPRTAIARRERLRNVMVLALLSGGGVALAQPAAPSPGFYYGVSLGTTYDDNVFRTSSSVAAPRSDWTYTYGAIAGFDRTYSKTRVSLSGALTRVTHSDLNDLDYTGNDLRGGVSTNVIGDINLGLDGTQTRTQARFADLTGGARLNVISRRALIASVDVPIAVNWRLVATGGPGRIRNSNVIDKPGDIDTTDTSAGVRYTTGPGNRLDLLVRRSKGDYLDPGTTPGALSDYSENGAELRGGLALSGNSRLDGRLAYTKRKNDTRRDLDFSSPQYDLTYTYRLSGATTLALAALRQRGTVGDQLLQNATATTFRFLPTVALSAKVNLRGTLEQTRRSLLADASAPAGSTRSERVRAYGFGASWAAQRWLLVDLDLRREQRSASVSGFDYDANVGALNLTARF